MQGAATTNISYPIIHMLIRFTSSLEDSGTDTPSTNEIDAHSGTLLFRDGKSREAADHLGESEPPAPDNYITYDRDWYQPGNLFAVWAPKDLEIHQKRFILLDTKNEGGTGVRVDVLQNMKDLQQLNRDKYADLKNMVLTCCETRGGDHSKHSEHERERNSVLTNEEQVHLLERLKKRVGKVHMYEHGTREQSVAPGSFIRLAHVYNIPFHWMIEDLGAIQDHSLQDLRFARMRWQARFWNLEDRVKTRTWVGISHT